MRALSRSVLVGAFAAAAFVGPAVAANAMDLGSEHYTVTSPRLAANSALPDLGSENITININNNELLNPLCLGLSVRSRTLGQLVGPAATCVP